MDRGEGGWEWDEEHERKREKQAFDKIPVHNDSLLYICVSGSVAHLYATAAAQCSLANLWYALLPCRVETPCIMFVSLCLSLSLALVIFFPLTHHKKAQKLKYVIRSVWRARWIVIMGKCMRMAVGMATSLSQFITTFAHTKISCQWWDKLLLYFL